MTLEVKRNKHRILLYADGRHVGTIIEQGKELFQWIVTAGTGHAGSYEKALEQVEEHLKEEA